MAKKQYLDLTGLTTYNDEIKEYINGKLVGKSDVGHSHKTSTIAYDGNESDILSTENTLTQNLLNLESAINGKAASIHNHSASEITTGTLPLSIGGTGTDLSNATAGSIIAKSSSGNKLSYWAQVPIERGGTAATTADSARANLGAASASDVATLQDLVGNTSVSTQIDTALNGHTHSQLNGSGTATDYGAIVHLHDVNSTLAYLRPTRDSGYISMGHDDYRFQNLYLKGDICIGSEGSGTTYTNSKAYISSSGFYLNGTNLKNHLVNSSESASSSYGDIILSTTGFRPTITNKISCGGASYVWTQVYATKTTITSSDRRVKRDIKNLDDRYIELFDLIEPKSYYLLDGDRVHTGFISQDVEEAMVQVGLTAEEVAFFCKDIKTEAVYDENGDIVEEREVLDEDGNPVYIYALRYEEYIAIMAEKIKRLESKYNAKLEELDAKLASL